LESALVEATLAIHRGEPRVSIALIERWLRSRDERHSGAMHSGGELSIHTTAALALLVESQLAAGNLSDATAAAEQLAELALIDKWGLALAHSALAQGMIKNCSGDTDLAQPCFEEAIERCALLELPLETARARCHLAQAMYTSLPEGAVVEAQGALAVFDRLGAAADADKTAALLRSWGVTGRTGPRDIGLLTKREQEVLELVAAGLSNPEIARRLYISRKTVAHHISNLMSKLGLRNRTEAAAYLSRIS
jgi:DNA-binding CsgD family transcriptional regulator